ncbi:uncharacterized protein LOC125537582 isoform X2 [Triticum urartu]|uniref:uncharacterized protein LOC125537582 isoform X2 n=1 Tax=Triticum urartu TaxID=4572 RepID=UPI002044898E|nr:uncharacterized protein LOC125537582 isoform X2 [Triticum urartu]
MNLEEDAALERRRLSSQKNEKWQEQAAVFKNEDGDVSMYTYVLETLDLSGGVCVLLYPLPATLIYTLSTSRCITKFYRGAGFSSTMTSQAAGLCIVNWRSLIFFRSTREKMERLDYSRLLLWSRGASTSSCRATSCGTDEPAACHSSTKVKNSC